MALVSRFLSLPDTLSRWTWPKRINPCHEEVSSASATWLRSFGALSPEKQAAYDRSKAALLASLVFPDADEDLLRAACDFMNIVFLIDDITEGVDAPGTQTLLDISVDAVRNPERPRPAGEHVLGEIVRQYVRFPGFWSRAVANSTASGRVRFADDWTRYIESVTAQAQDRDEGRLRSTEEYLALRRYTIGADPVYALAALKVDLPLEVSDLPLFRRIRRCITDIILFDNDLLSYPKEYAARDDEHNVITLVMHERGLDLDGAVAWLVAEHAKRVDEFLALWPEVSALRFGSDEVDEAVAAYLDHLANWPRAHIYWIFESGRYFGKDGRRVEKERAVELAVRADASRSV